MTLICVGHPTHQMLNCLNNFSKDSFPFNVANLPYCVFPNITSKLSTYSSQLGHLPSLFIHQGFSPLQSPTLQMQRSNLYLLLNLTIFICLRFKLKFKSTVKLFHGWIRKHHATCMHGFQFLLNLSLG